MERSNAGHYLDPCQCGGWQGTCRTRPRLDLGWGRMCGSCRVALSNPGISVNVVFSAVPCRWFGWVALMRRHLAFSGTGALRALLPLGRAVSPPNIALAPLPAVLLGRGAADRTATRFPTAVRFPDIPQFRTRIEPTEDRRVWNSRRKLQWDSFATSLPQVGLADHVHYLGVFRAVDVVRSVPK